MEYWQILLMVLWRDVREFGAGLIWFSLLLAFLSYGLARGVRAATAARHEQVGTAAWWGWLGGIAIFTLARFAVAVLRVEGWWHHRLWFHVALSLLALVGSGSCSLFYFIRARQSPETSNQARWRFSLRTILAVQIVLALCLGVWITARREEIQWQIDWRKQKAEWERQLQHRAMCEARFSPYGWSVYLNPKGGDGPLQLHLLQKQYDQQLSGFRDSVLAEITPQEQIVFLHLTSNALTDEGLEIIGTFTTLEKLRVVSSQITDAGLAHLKNLRNLKELEVSSDEITDAGVANFRDLPHLERISVQSAELTAASLEHLAAIKSLQYGSIYDSQITREQQAIFLRDRQDASAKIYATEARSYPPPPKVTPMP